MTDRARAERLDAHDPLASFRDRFAIDDPETIYLDGNSLGRLPLATRGRLSELTDSWGSALVRGWHDWIDLPERLGDLLASAVLGARPGEVIVTDSTTVNLFKLAGAVLEIRPGAIVTDSENFPTDRYVLEGLARLHGRELRIFDADPLNGPQPEDVKRACEAGGVALVSLSHVAYRSGALADIGADRPSRGPGAGDLGPLALRGRCSDRAGAARGGAGRGLHLQVPERRPGRARRSSTCAETSRSASERRSRAGSDSATNSRWSVRTTRRPACAASSPAHRRSSRSRVSRRGRS